MVKASSARRYGPLRAGPWRRGALAVVAGALPALCFPAPALWWLAYVTLVPWLLLIRSAGSGRRAALDGWLGGAGFLLAVHHWLLPSLHVFILVLAALLGLLWAPWGLVVHRLLGGSPGVGRCAAALVVVPSAWLMVELVRSWEYLGGPWGLFGASQWQVAPALRLASLGGIWLVSFLLVALNTALATLVRAPRARATGAVGVLACAAVAAGGWVWAPQPRGAGTVRIAVVQPGVISGAHSPQRRFDREEELTRRLVGHRPDLVVWGESSVGEDLDRRPDLRNRLAALSRETGADLLVNVDARRTDRPGIFKSSVLIGPGGPTGDRYDKMRLVPFGEYVPARSVLGWATSVGKAAGEDRQRGERQVLMRLPAGGTAAGGLRIGPLVCFESAFPDMSRKLARDGAQVIVAQSATSTFQHSWAPRQHASLAAMRAAETWRPVVHATLTGVSTVAGPRGEIVGTPLGTERSASAVYEVPLARGTSPYVRTGDWAVLGSVGILVCYAAAEVLRRFTRREVRKPAPEHP
ncbi:acyltransferase [Streptomyces eurocidicus]|uniref:Apolipoprotein N-acyltransferase n=1 Tax=Streptomyces eurocidicus TaxID=66423 RepID=A0A2N8NQH1_STREU|nr:apolipoprotein N-acyltransferase [Streptomyces eurocidicus]MBB5122548.1 apolipoprotein N-acyltransferase [Streptomyces eurocidicus]MBF6055296.1 apolipoprotein N-acyltransferase [Streptomyces eurocidicus]PNE31015.1 acyltransferase [Streptomyces eurocidicus]